MCGKTNVTWFRDVWKMNIVGVFFMPDTFKGKALNVGNGIVIIISY